MGKSKYVLDVGAGDNPDPRADIAVDAHKPRTFKHPPRLQAYLRGDITQMTKDKANQYIFDKAIANYLGMPDKFEYALPGMAKAVKPGGEIEMNIGTLVSEPDDMVWHNKGVESIEKKARKFGTVINKRHKKNRNFHTTTIELITFNRV